MKNFLLFVLVVTPMFIGCDDNEKDQMEKDPAQKNDLPFTIIINGVGPTYVKTQWNPDDLTMAYVPMLGIKENMDVMYADDESLVNSDLDMFREMADKYGLKLSEVLDLLCVSGVYESNMSNLLPETDYYAYTYGLSPDGVATTPVTKCTFHTTSLQPCDFELSCVPTSSSCEVSIQCGTQDNFFWDITLASNIESIDDQTIAETCLSNLQEKLETLKKQQPEATMADLLSKGSDDKNFSSLIPATDYVVYAYSTTSEGDRLSTITRKSFRTLESTVVNPCTFSVTCSNVTTVDFDVTVVPTDPATRYYVGICSKEDWDSYSPEQIAAMFIKEEGTNVDWETGLNEDGNSVIHTGENVFNIHDDLYYSYSSFKCNTEYVAVVFGVDNTGTAETEIASCIQKTSDIPSDFTIDLNVKNLTADGVVFESKPSDPTVLYYISMAERELVDKYGDGDIEKYAKHDLSISESFIDYLVYRGDYEVDYSGMCEANTPYFAFAYAYAGGEIISPVFWKEVITPQSARGLSMKNDLCQTFLDKVKDKVKNDIRILNHLISFRQMRLLSAGDHSESVHGKMLQRFSPSSLVEQNKMVGKTEDSSVHFGKPGKN